MLTEATHLQAILNSVGTPACLTRGEDIVLVNAAAEALFGSSADELQDETLHDFFRVPSARLIKSVLESDSMPLNGQLSLKMPDNNERRLDWSIHRAPYAGDNFFLHTFVDSGDPCDADFYQLLVEQSPDLIYVIEPHLGVPVYYNRIWFLDYHQSQLDSHASFMRFIHPEDVELLSRHRRGDTLSDHDTAVLEYRMNRRDGGWEWLQSRISPLEQPGDSAHLLLEQISIITVRKEAEQILQNRNDQLEAMSAISLALSSSLELEQVLDIFLQRLRTLVAYDSASIRLMTREESHYLAQFNIPNWDDIRDRASQMGLNAAARHIIETRRPLIIADVREDIRWQYIPGTEYIRGWMGVPLLSRDQVIGILSLDSREVNFYLPEHAQQVMAVAQQAAMAISNARLYRKSQTEILERARTEGVLTANLRKANALYQIVRLFIAGEDIDQALSSALRVTADAIDSLCIMLMTFDASTGALQYLMVEGHDSVDQAWQDFAQIVGLKAGQRAMPPEDLSWPHGVRMRLNDGRQAIAAAVGRRGVLAAVNPSDDLPYTPGDQDMLVTIAGQMTIAIENATLYRRLRQYTTHLERLVDRRTTALSLERERLRIILDAVDEGIIYMEDFQFLYANPAFCRMVGYDVDDLMSKPLSMIRAEDDDDADDDPLALMRSQNDHNNEAVLRRRDGSTFYASITFTLIGNLGEQPVRMVAVVRDISREHALQQQRMRFMANAAHELRTPLTSFGLRLHMIRRQPNRMDEHLNVLDRVSNYLKLLVEELLDLTRFDRGEIHLEYELVDIATLIQQAVSEHDVYAQEVGVTLQNNATTSMEALVDTTRMYQLISILVVNAINYCEDKCTAEIELAQVEWMNVSHLRLQIKDDGLGIAQELLPEQIFQPFARPRLGDRQETGMGLAIAREIVNLHAGIIQAENRQPKGSIVTVLIPIAPVHMRD